LATRERIGREVVRVREMIDRGGQLRGELTSVRLDAADGCSAKAYPVIAACASDKTNTVRPTLGLPIGQGDLEGRGDRFRTRMAEEDVIEIAGKHLRELLRELEGERVRHLEWRRVVHDARLLSDRRRDRFATVSGVHAPKSGGSVEDLPTVGRGVVHTISGDEHPRRPFEGAIRGEGEPELFQRRGSGNGGECHGLDGESRTARGTNSEGDERRR